MIRKRLLQLVVLLPLLNQAYGQTRNCAQNLLSAEKSFEEGVLKAIPNLITKCVETGKYSKPEEIRARKLLTIAYLFMDNQLKAEESMVRLLRLSPELKIDPANDPDEFIFLHDKYKTDPIFRIGAFIGVNNTSVSNMDEFGVYNLNESDGVTYNGLFNLTLGGSLDVLITSDLEIALEASYATRTFEINSVGNYIGGYTIKLSETQSWVDIPLMVKYSFFSKKNIVPYIYAGGAYNLMLTSRISGDRNGDPSITVNNIDIVRFGDLRNRFNYSVLAGGGVRVKTNTDYFKLDIRYVRGLTNLVNESNRFDNQQLALNLGYVDNNFSLDYYQVTIGFVHSVFNPKKLKRYRK